MSSEAQRRASAKYNKEHRANLTVALPKELIAEFNAAIEKNGDTKYMLIKNFVLEYIEQTKGRG